MRVMIAQVSICHWETQEHKNVNSELSDTKCQLNEVTDTLKESNQARKELSKQIATIENDLEQAQSKYSDLKAEYNTLQREHERNKDNMVFFRDIYDSRGSSSLGTGRVTRITLKSL